MNIQNAIHFINSRWDESIIPALQEYIKIPNKSPHYDAKWKEHGYMDQAADLIANWCLENAVRNMSLEKIQLEERTPIILIDIPGASNETILLYGHFDKQPEMTGWDADLGPWKPVIKGDRLYGRGSADDGYAAFASLTAIKTLQEQNLSHARCVILLEASEESGSIDLPFYIEALKDKIGNPNLVICLDSGCGNYEQLWVTTSLRGVLTGNLIIDVLTQGIHSGMGSGIVPACFRILRQLLNRIEDESTGDIKISELQVSIPEQRIQQANAAAKILGKSIYEDLPFLPGVTTESNSISELILRRTWRPALAITGCDGIPAIENAGNVTLPTLSVNLSIRLSPTTNPNKAAEIIKTVLEKDPPHHAKVRFECTSSGPGWNAPLETEWLVNSVQKASQNIFNKDAVYLGEGGSIPFMGMLGEKFPEAQFVITGLLGPESNAHGPNEFLHIPTGKKLTACIANIIHEHFNRS